MSERKLAFLNLPNSLTLFRIFAIPLICYWLAQGDPLSCIGAAILFGVAAVTDFFDGYLARSRGLVTLTGKFLDPLADKLIVMGALVVLVQLQWFPAWLVILVLAREIGITGLRGIASNEGIVIDAGTTGKYKTAFQLTGLFSLLVHYRYTVDFWLFESPVNFHSVGFWLFAISVFFSLWSAFGYAQGFVRALDERDTAAA